MSVRTSNLPPADASSSSGGGSEIVLMVAAAIGWCLSVQYVMDAREQYRSGTFPHVVGIMSKYEWKDVGTEGGSALEVAYSWSVNDRRYQGDRKRFAFRAFDSGSADAVALAKSWGPGHRVKVFIDPDDPSKAALDNLFTPGDWKTLAGALVLFAATSVLAVIRVLPVISGLRTTNSDCQRSLADRPIR